MNPEAISFQRSAGGAGAAQPRGPTTTDWRRVAARMQRELDRADLGDRATRLARVLVSLTLAERRVEVLLTDRAELCRLLGIGENHIGGVFDLLAASGIASCARVAEGWRVRVFSDSASWRCEWHFEREALCAYLLGVNRAPGQVQGELWEPEPDLQRAKAEVDVEAAGKFPKREVPEKGSSRVNRETVLPASQLSRSSQHFEEAVKPGKLLNGEAREPRRGVPFTPAERELLGRLRELLGDEQVRQWGGDWVANFIRPMPRALSVALDELESHQRAGKVFARPAHWVKSTARHVQAAQVVHTAMNSANRRPVKRPAIEEMNEPTRVRSGDLLHGPNVKRV